MSEFLSTRGGGMVQAETTPPDTDALYASPQELNALYGCEVTEADIRAAMSLLHAWTNRPSLWPTVYEHEVRVAADRFEARLPVTPVLRLLDASGRYATGRRDRQGLGSVAAEIGTLLMLSGGRASWTALAVDTLDVVPETGVVYLPTGIFAVPWGAVRMRYVAGYTQIADRVKLALFEMISTMHTKGQSDRTRYSGGRVSRTYASDSFVTPQAQMLLAPFVVTALA